MRISDWSSDVCSSDLAAQARAGVRLRSHRDRRVPSRPGLPPARRRHHAPYRAGGAERRAGGACPGAGGRRGEKVARKGGGEGKGVSVRVVLRWRRYSKNKRNNNRLQLMPTQKN